MTIKMTDNEITLNFTGGNIEGYAARLALGLLIHDPNSFSPEDAQRINTLLAQQESDFYLEQEDMGSVSEVLKNND